MRDKVLYVNVDKDTNMDKHKKRVFWFSIGVILSGIIYALLTPYPIHALPIFEPPETVVNLFPLNNHYTHLQVEWMNEHWWFLLPIEYEITSNSDMGQSIWDEDYNLIWSGTHTNTITQGIQDDDTTVCSTSLLLKSTYGSMSNYSGEVIWSVHERGSGGCNSFQAYIINTTDGSKISNFAELRFRPNKTAMYKNSTIFTYKGDTIRYWDFTVGDGLQQDLFLPAFASDISDIDLTGYQIGNVTNHRIVWIAVPNKIYALIYDRNDNMNYLGSFDVSDVVDFNTTYQQFDVSQDSLDSGIHYVTYMINNSVRIHGLDYFSAVPKFIQWDTNVYTLTDNVNDFLEYPRMRMINQKGYLFYLVQNQSDYTGMRTRRLVVVEETLPCSCTEWIPQGIDSCIDDKMLELRVCSPDECDTEERYVYDDYCNQTQGLINRTDLQRIERFCEYQTCQDEWQNPKESSSSSCEATLVINEDCIDINSTATITTNVEWSNWWLAEAHISDNRYTLTLCNPIWEDCFIENPFCIGQWNRTRELFYDGYYAGDTIQAHYEISNAHNCRVERIFGQWVIGWNRYRATGQLEYCCDRLCGGYKCVKRGLVWYRMFQFPNCQLDEDTKELCEVGCNDGVCVTDLPEEETTRLITGNIFEWIFSEATFIFPNIILNFMAVGISALTGVYASLQTNKMEIGLAVMMGFVLLFLTMGWLPTIIGILWILGIALLLVNMIAQPFKRS